MLGIVHKGHCIILSRGKAVQWCIHIPCPSQLLPSMSRHKSLSNQFRSIWNHLKIKSIHLSSLLRVSAKLTFRHGWVNLIAASSHQGCEVVDCTGISWEFWVTHCSLSGRWRVACWKASTSYQSAKPSCPDCHGKLALPLAQVFCRIT